jgi:hypothetical protein
MGEEYKKMLIHHGIKGQKWGSKNGPPYPLSQKKHDQVVKGKRDGSYKGKTDESTELRNYSKQTTMKSGAGMSRMAVPFDILFGDFRSAKKDLEYAKKASAAAEKRDKILKERKGEEIDEKTGFHLKNREMTDEEDMERVNPMFESSISSVRNNCMLCTNTFELRQRGYDVMANTTSLGIKVEDIGRWFNGAKPSQVKGSNENYIYREKNPDKMFSILDEYVKHGQNLYKSTVSALLKQGEGARGNLCVQWLEGYGSGHSVAYKIKNQKVEIIDAQDGKKYDLEKLMSRAATATFVRLDNLELNYEHIREVAS